MKINICTNCGTQIPEKYYLCRKCWVEKCLVTCSKCGINTTHAIVVGQNPTKYLCPDCEKKYFWTKSSE